MIRSSACQPWQPDRPGHAGDGGGPPQLHHATGHDLSRLATFPGSGARSRRNVRAENPAACTSAHLCSAGWDLVPITPEGTRPVLREAHMTRFSKMFAAVSGAVAIVGVTAFLVSPASTTQAGTYEVAQINPDQITRNAPRDLPSFEQKYQMHTGVLDTLRR